MTQLRQKLALAGMIIAGASLAAPAAKANEPDFGIRLLATVANTLQTTLMTAIEAPGLAIGAATEAARFVGMVGQEIGHDVSTIVQPKPQHAPKAPRPE